MTGNFVKESSNHKQFYLYGNQSQMPQAMPVMPGGEDRWGFYNNVSTGAITALNPNPNNINNQGWAWSNTNNTMQRWEFFIKLNEPFTEKNGIIRAWLNGKKGIDNSEYQVRHVDGEFIDFRLGHMANGFYQTANAWFDDVYIATTQARVEVCNSDIYDNCTVKHLQYIAPNNWTSTSINVNLRNLPAFRFNELPIYLYVIDKEGVASNPIVISKPKSPLPN